MLWELNRNLHFFWHEETHQFPGKIHLGVPRGCVGEVSLGGWLNCLGILPRDPLTNYSITTLLPVWGVTSSIYGGCVCPNTSVLLPMALNSPQHNQDHEQFPLTVHTFMICNKVLRLLPGSRGERVCSKIVFQTQISSKFRLAATPSCSFWSRPRVSHPSKGKGSEVNPDHRSPQASGTLSTWVWGDAVGGVEPTAGPRPRPHQPSHCPPFSVTSHLLCPLHLLLICQGQGEVYLVYHCSVVDSKQKRNNKLKGWRRELSTENMYFLPTCVSLGSERSRKGSVLGLSVGV